MKRPGVHVGSITWEPPSSGRQSDLANPRKGRRTELPQARRVAFLRPSRYVSAPDVNAEPFYAKTLRIRSRCGCTAPVRQDGYGFAAAAVAPGPSGRYTAHSPIGGAVGVVRFEECRPSRCPSCHRAGSHCFTASAVSPHSSECPRSKLFRVTLEKSLVARSMK